MSVTGRQSNLFLAEDWKKIYQTFKNADFTSYDFENMRRVMIAFLRENYPEDFNDYIESSEYLALIDLIAFLGQSLAFRIDINARENFLETAERRESILRLAQLLSYNVKRNLPANGLLKIDQISTTEEVIDSTGRNLSNIQILWNDVTNSNWFDQFTKVINATMIAEQEFGIPGRAETITNIYTEQYKINNSQPEVPLYSFSKSIDGRSTAFEVTSTIISNGEIKEDNPRRNNQVSVLYRDDLKGYGSINTGWFMHFRQGSLQETTFNIVTPTPNYITDIDATNINDSDIWLYSINSDGSETQLWTKVPEIVGNNIVYNSLDRTIKNVYQVVTRATDAVSLVFGDGTFANIPKGNFVVYYRVSNGLTYTISPKDIKGISINIPYISKRGSAETLRLVLSLKSSINNASSSETNTEVKIRAPSTYYTQNRMITGEDYNLAPLNSSQNVAKVKSVNRTASGISRNFDLVDASGKYSTTNAFCTDGIIYREEIENSFEFRFVSRTDIENVIKNKVEPLTKLPLMRDFYYEKYNKIVLTELNATWKQATSANNETTGYFADKNDGLPFKVSTFTGSSLKYIEPGALIKFLPPVGYYFENNGTLVTLESPTTSSSIWSKVISVVGDGTASGQGILSTGIGPVVFNEIIPSEAAVEQIIPKFLSYLDEDLQALIVDLIFNFRNFGVRYDISSRSWQIIQDRNLNVISAWSLGKTGDNTGQKLDSSWLFAFETDGEKYTVTYRGLEYYFESIKENRFFFDGTKKIFDVSTGKLQKDKVSVLKFNTKPNNVSNSNINRDYPWEIVGTALEEHGYTSSKTVKITFADSDDDGIVDNPEAFNIIVDPSTTNSNRFVFFEKYLTDNYVEDYRFVENTAGKFVILAREDQVGNLMSYNDGQLFYFYENDILKKLDKARGSLIVTRDYYANHGRNGLYFHYLHNADSTSRIDPSSTNIIDVYLLTKDYDSSYRKYLRGDITTEPLPPSSTDLKLTYGKNLDKIKSISDDLVYHPVKYKVLFGDTAEARLQASFKIVKNKEQVITDNDIKSRVIQAIDEFFSVDNWDFGDTFYFTELSTYVMNRVTPFITTFVIVPTNNDQVYGSLQQITSAPNEIFISGARVNNIEIIEAVTASRLKSQGFIVTSSTIDVNSTNLRSSIR